MRLKMLLCFYSAWLGVMPSFSQDESMPNVIVLIADDHVIGEQSATAHGVLDHHLLEAKKKDRLDIKWRAYRGHCNISPGRSACMAALLYGKSALLAGVVSDHDWRRKPISGESILDQYHSAGYDTALYPTGNKRATLTDIWGNREVSIDSTKKISADVARAFNTDKPVFRIIQQGYKQDDPALARLMQIQIIPSAQASTRATVVLIIRIKPLTGKPKRGILPDKAHYPADWYLYHHGKHDDFLAADVGKLAKADWRFHEVLEHLLGRKMNNPPDYYFFHRASWPHDESPDKYRHRGSLVIGKNYALVNGLELYPATKNLEPDLTSPLDIAQHQKLHSELLRQHAKWWQQARKALHNPRAFIVGKNDNVTTRLTARDWHPSKIIRTDGTSPSSQPLVYQKDLLTLLQNLKNEKYRTSFPAYSGSWFVNIVRPGRYKITASLLPKEAQQTEKLQGGLAFFQLGSNEVQLTLHRGASAISALIDADAGVKNLECWFTGQLALERELGAFFVEIERVGEKKFNLNTKSP